MPAGGPVSEGYSEWVGLIYIFNLIVGTGALAMPKAFADAGWLLSVIGIVILAFISYVTATFMIEAMAASNALELFKKLQLYKKVSNLQEGPDDQENGETSERESREEEAADEITATNETDMVDFANNPFVRQVSYSALESVAESPSTDYFAINDVFEMGRMASMYYSKWGLRLFYMCIALYLYGDLAIYGTAVAKSLRDVFCDKINQTQTEDSSTLCWSTTGIDRFEAYRLFLTVFIVLIGPFTFFNVQKTKYLQIFTTIMRWSAFLSMIALCFVAIIGGKAEGAPSAAKPLELPTLFGVCVYSFMCHHSLPSLVTPITKKKHIYKLIAGDFLLIWVFYNLLSLTGVFTFKSLKDTYTLDFEPQTGESVVPVFAPLQYFLALFPVVTLSTNFPIIAITLQNNLRTLLREQIDGWVIADKVAIPILVLILPMMVSYLTDNLEYLVLVTGAFAGAVIQYVIPASLVYLARKQVMLQMGIGVRNNFASPFRGSGWIWFMMGWTGVCMILVSIHAVQTLIEKPQ